MKKIAIVAVAVLAVLCVLPSADAAVINDSPDGTLKFDNMSGGDIRFSIWSDSEFTMTVTVTEGSSTVATKEVEIATGTTEVSVHISSPSPGTHQYRVTCSPSEQFPSYANGFNVTVDVSKNVLSNWVTYLVVAIVIIVVAVFAYMKIRDTPKNKPEMTFEELEAQRKAEMAEKGQKKQAKSSKTTERQRYLSDKKKKD